MKQILVETLVGCFLCGQGTQYSLQYHAYNKDGTNNVPRIEQKVPCPVLTS